MEKFDLIVVGVGPSGEKAAVKAAFFGKKVAVVEKGLFYGGALSVTGTLPSKTLKETALYLSGQRERGLYGIDRHFQRPVSVEDFMFRKNYITETESKCIAHNLERHGITVYHGEASLEDTNTVCISGQKKIWGEYILLATGSSPVHPDWIPFDQDRVHDSDSILHIKRFPRSLCICGGGVIGCEYATIFAAMGTRVVLLNPSENILSFLDLEITQALIQEMKESGIQLLLGKKVQEVHKGKDSGDDLILTLDDGMTLPCDMFLFAAGRKGNVEGLHCENVGIQVDDRGHIPVSKQYQTCVSNIYAVGDLVGFPSLASTSMEQGRIAVGHMFSMGGIKCLPESFPYGIYTIPEISMVGKSEEQLLREGVSYGVGRAFYTDMARGKIMGSRFGFLKLVFDVENGLVLGVHIIGPLATELIHFGMNVVEHGETLLEIINYVFNYPTLHDLYKYAAYDGLPYVEREVH